MREAAASSGLTPPAEKSRGGESAGERRYTDEDQHTWMVDFYLGASILAGLCPFVEIF